MTHWIRGKTQSPVASIWLAIVVLAIAVVIVLPNYITGQWSWAQTSSLEPVKVLRSLSKNGITLAGWQVVDQQTIELGHKKWSVQAMMLTSETEPTSILNQALTTLSDAEATRLREEPSFIFLRPQSDAKDEPLVEWIDFGGLQRWTADQVQSSVGLSTPSALPSSASGSGAEDQTDTLAHRFFTRYFRGWNQNHTYAVMQWYAWPDGGSPKISTWFWADQWQQWRQHQRMPWVAVTVLVPMKPLGDSSDNQAVVEAIAQSIQVTLEQHIASTGLG